MEFYVHDNIENYNNRFTYNGFEKTRLFVQDMYIPQTGAFWFRTDFNEIEKNVDMHKKYLHIHGGLTQFGNMKFDVEPHVVKRSELFYNPETRCIEIKIAKRFFRSEIIFRKMIESYHGTKLPNRAMTVLGSIIFDLPNKQIHFILNYYGNNEKVKVHFERESELPTMEQRMKVSELEDKIREAELKINPTF